MKPKTMLRGVVEKLVYGAYGLVREENGIIFIPDVLPGEEIMYSIREKKTRFAWGVLEHILKKSPYRIDPVCPYTLACGGCQLQHVEYSRQVEYKREWILENLSRIAQITDVPVECSPAQEFLFYRRRIQLHIQEANFSYRLGYISRDNVTLVEVDQCPIFCPQQELLLDWIRNLISFWKAPKGSAGKVYVIKGIDGGYTIDIRLPKQPLKEIEESLICGQASCSLIDGVYFSGKTCAQWVKKPLSVEYCGLICAFSPGVFVQNHLSQSSCIYQDIISFLKQNISKDIAILDLYCGIGVLTLLIAKEGYKITGIEINKESINCAKKNAQKNQITQARFMALSVEQWLKSCPKHNSCGVWIVNPPRVGLSQHILVQISKVLPGVIIYVSCDPSTLARDIKELYAQGYRIDQCRGYDMFPQTTHVETVVWLRKARS